MTVLVTGGSGLVGSRLIHRLVAAKVDCRVLVRPGKAGPAGVAVVEGDLLDPASLETAVDGASTVVHFAALLRTPDSDAIWRTNVEGTRNLINAAKQSRSDPRFVMASTGLVYDEDSPCPALESDAAAPKMAYPASKLAAEGEVRESGLNWVILRLGFVYGDGDEHLQAVPQLAARFNWHPANRLSLVHHQDIATAVHLAMTGTFDRQVVNIVDDAPTSIYKIGRLVGGGIRPSSEPLPHPWRSQLDGTLARSLGFRPVIPSVHQARALSML